MNEERRGSQRAMVAGRVKREAEARALRCMDLRRGASSINVRRWRVKWARSARRVWWPALVR